MKMRIEIQIENEEFVEKNVISIKYNKIKETLKSQRDPKELKFIKIKYYLYLYESYYQWDILIWVYVRFISVMAV